MRLVDYRVVFYDIVVFCERVVFKNRVIWVVWGDRLLVVFMIKEGFLGLEFDFIGEGMELTEYLWAELRLSLRVEYFIEFELKVDMLLGDFVQGLVSFDGTVETKEVDFDDYFSIDETCFQ